MKLHLSMTSPAFEGSTFKFAPRAVSTSAAPHFEDTLRLPCFATFTPPAATTKEAQVERLNEHDLSPPVPTMSMLSDVTEQGRATSRMTCAEAAISSTVSPFKRRAVR